MRFFCVLLFFLFSCPVCWAVEYQSVPTADFLEELSVSDFEVLESKVRSLNVDLVDENSDKSQAEKISIYRSWLGQKSFDYYRDFFIKDFVDKSISTGRKIKCGDNTSCSTDIESIKQGGTYWLDAGKLDSPECYLEGNKLYRICDYPSGFEEYILVSDENNFYVIKDDSQKNKTYWVDVMYVNQVGAGSQHYVFFDISITEGDYTKWKEYESRENEKKLMWEKMTKRQKRKFSKLLKNGEVEEQENDAMPEVNVVGRAVELMGN